MQARCTTRRCGPGQGKPSTRAIASHAMSSACATIGFASAKTPAKTAESASGTATGSTDTLPSRVRPASACIPETAAPILEGSFAIADSADTIASGMKTLRARIASAKTNERPRPASTVPVVGAYAQRSATIPRSATITAVRVVTRRARAATNAAAGTTTKSSARPCPPAPSPSAP